MVRATTGGVLKSYRYNLMNSFIRDNKARETVLTQRVFNSYAEDPAAAAKAFRLRKSRMMASSQLSVCEDTYAKHSSAFSCLLSIDELIDTTNGKGTAMTTLKGTTLEMLNDPKGDARVQLSKVLDNLGDEIIQHLNQTYGDEFIFAGADGMNVPFTVKEENGIKKLYYRGVSVDAADPNVLKDGNNFIQVDQSGNLDATNTSNIYLKLDNTKVMSQADYTKLTTPPSVATIGGVNVGYDENLQPITDPSEPAAYYQRVDAAGQPTNEFVSVEDYANEMAQANNPPKRFSDGTNPVEVNEEGVPTAGGGYWLVFDGDPQVINKAEYEKEKLEADKLEYLMNEKRFVDIGLGFKEDENGKLIESSAFNDALNGLTFIGSGLDEDGEPKNIYSILQRLKQIAESVPEEGEWSEEVYEEFRGMVLKLEDASSNFKTEFTNMDAGTQKLKTNVGLLEGNVYDLKEQYSNIEDVNMADAISSFLWAEYCYNAALKVGNSILSQSLMDYLT